MIGADLDNVTVGSRSMDRHTGHVTSLAHCADRNYVVSGGGHGQVFLWDAAGVFIRDYLIDNVHPARKIDAVALSPSGELVAAAGYGKSAPEDKKKQIYSVWVWQTSS